MLRIMTTCFAIRNARIKKIHKQSQILKMNILFLKIIEIENIILLNLTSSPTYFIDGRSFINSYQLIKSVFSR